MCCIIWWWYIVGNETRNGRIIILMSDDPNGGADEIIMRTSQSVMQTSQSVGVLDHMGPRLYTAPGTQRYSTLQLYEGPELELQPYECR